MRYYNLVVTDPNDPSQLWIPTSTGALVKTRNTNVPIQGSVSTPAGALAEVSVVSSRTAGSAYTFTSHPNGILMPPDPGALNIEFDIPTYPQHIFQGGATLRLSGVGLRMISQSANLNGQDFTFSAGMGKGLPLAKPAQAGEIIRGRIYRAFGNWQGTEQTLDLICWNATSINPVNDILFDWQPGQTFANAIATTLKQAFPTFTPKMGSLSPLLQAPPKNTAQQHTATGLSDFAVYIKELTQLTVQFAGDLEYGGVWLLVDGNNIRVSDGTQTPKTVPIAFEDMIGQPTWSGTSEITFKTVLRSDIQVTDLVTLPSTIHAPFALTGVSAAVPNVPASSSSAFTGTFSVTEIHHYGHFRQPDAESWNTTFLATFLPIAGQFQNAAQLAGAFA